MSLTGSGDRVSQIERGNYVLSRFACADLPPPPAGAGTSQPQVDETTTARDVADFRAQQPSCSGCHRLLDPLGFSLDAFDEVGARRTEDSFGRAIDTKVHLDEYDFGGPLQNDQALVDNLTNSTQVQTCAAAQLFSFVTKRRPHVAEACLLEQMSEAAFPARQLPILITSPTFGFVRRQP